MQKRRKKGWRQREITYRTTKKLETDTGGKKAKCYEKKNNLGAKAGGFYKHLVDLGAQIPLNVNAVCAPKPLGTFENLRQEIMRIRTEPRREQMRHGHMWGQIALPAVTNVGEG